MINPIKKYLEWIDRDVENRMREDLMKKGLSQNDVDSIMKLAKNEDKKLLTPEERLKQRKERLMKEGNPRITSCLK